MPNYYTATIQDIETKKFFTAEAEADNEEQAINELREFYAYELDTLPTFIQVLKINKI